MKKRKLLIPITGLTILGGIVPAIMTSCSAVKLEDLLNIGTENNVLYGFKDGVTQQQIENACQGTFVIPARVRKILPYAFVKEETLETKIPSSVKKLVFAKDKDGRNHLQGSEADGDLPAIGRYCFANAPFEYIDFPLDLYCARKFGEKIMEGRNYDIGEGAFMGSKLKVLHMPELGFFNDPKMIGQPEEQQLGWMKICCEVIDEDGTTKKYGKEAFELIDKWEIFKTAGLKRIGKFAFANCENLTSIIISPFTTNNKSYIDLKAFGTYDFATEVLSPSKINFIDASGLLYRKPISNDSAEIVEAANVQDQHIKSGCLEYGPESFCGLNLDWKIKQGIIKTFSHSTMLFLKGDKAEGFKYMDQWFNAFGLYYSCSEGKQKHALQSFESTSTQSGGNYAPGFFYDTTMQPEEQMTKWMFPIVAGYSIAQGELNMPTIDGIYLFDNNFKLEIDMSNENNYIGTLRRAVEASTTPANGKFILPDDIKFDITSAEWTTGKAVNISLNQMKKDDVPEGHPAKLDWANQCYKVVCDKKPSSGSVVELKVHITSAMHNVDIVDVPLQITFK